ncbi:MAG: metal-sensing transcriptional repressor [Lachnospiraceae bacterium]
MAEQKDQETRDINPDRKAQTSPAAEETGACPACSGRHVKRTPEEQKALLSRLRRVEGQIRGIEKMVENDAYCPDILIQVSAATSALNSFNKTLLGCHIRGCVATDIRNGNDETIDELCNVLQKLMK